MSNEKRECIYCDNIHTQTDLDMACQSCVTELNAGKFCNACGTPQSCCTCTPKGITWWQDRQEMLDLYSTWSNEHESRGHTTLARLYRLISQGLDSGTTVKEVNEKFLELYNGLEKHELDCKLFVYEDIKRMSRAILNIVN